MPKTTFPAPLTPTGLPAIPLVPKGAEALSVREWWHHVGTDNLLKVVKEMGTSLAYMRQIAYRCKLPSYRFAKAMIAAAQRHTPGFAPDLERMLEPIPPRQSLYAVKGVGVRPSAQFRAHQRYLEAVARGDLPLAMSAEEGEALVARLMRAAEEDDAVLALLQQRTEAEVLGQARTKQTKQAKPAQSVQRAERAA